MKITDIKFKKVSYKLPVPFKVAFGVIPAFESVIVKIETDSGLWGFGESSPLAFVTGDNVETAISIGNVFKKTLIGENPLCIERIVNIMDSLYIYNTSIKAAFDIALHDIAAKQMQVPLYEFLGGYGSSIETDMTIGIGAPEEMVRQSLERVAEGYTKLKIKLGTTPEEDIERIKKIREAVGFDTTIRVDANQGWSVKDSIKIIKELYSCNLELIEQPVEYWNTHGLKTIKASVDTPIVADESCHSPIDAANLIRNDAVDGVNIKLMKSGGLHKAKKINAIAEANGVFCMIGCMGETRIANVAGMHFAAAFKNVTTIDLDSSQKLEYDFITGGYENKGSLINFLDEPGLGITVDGM